MDERETFPMRINKYLAQRGFSTRRGADEIISRGQVTINGKVAVLGDKIQADDVVEVSKAATKSQKNFCYYAYYKPRGIITHSPDTSKAEKSIADVVDIKGIFPLGRLDKDSEGLIILTDDGRVTDRLLHPRYQHEKEYIVTVRENITAGMIKKLVQGVPFHRKKLEARSVERTDFHTLNIVLTEGSKHHIRRMLAGVNLTVEKLVRVRVMDITLKSQKSGTLRELKNKEKKDFLKALGL